jgi:hypothetical protein
MHEGGAPVKRAAAVLAATLLVSLSSCANSQLASQQQFVEGDGFRFVLPQGWTRDTLPPGDFVAVVTKTLATGGMVRFAVQRVLTSSWEAAAYDRHNIEAGQYSDLKRAMPSTVLLTSVDPKAKGRIVANLLYSATIAVGTKATLRTTMFVSRATCFMVTCMAPPKAWKDLVGDFDQMLETLEERDAFFVAVVANDTSGVVRWTRKGVDINTPERPNGWTALHYAANDGNVEMVGLLLRLGADPGVFGARGRGQGGTTMSPTPEAVAESHLALANMARSDPTIAPQYPQAKRLLESPSLTARYEEVARLLKEKAGPAK